MSKEDELVNAIIEMEQGIEAWESSFEPEAHYSHYGTRGVVDLYIQQSLKSGNRRDHVIEIKSDSAVARATGANEIIRQYNRMREGFYKDESRSVPRKILMELAFTVTPASVYHVVDNFPMYASADQADVTPSQGRVKANSRIVFRSAEFPHGRLELHNKDGDIATTADEWVGYLKEIDRVPGGPVSQLLAILKNKNDQNFGIE